MSKFSEAYAIQLRTSVRVDEAVDSGWRDRQFGFV